MTHAEEQKVVAENYKRTWREQFALQHSEPLLWGDKAFELLHVSDVLNSRYQAAAGAHQKDAGNAWTNYFRPRGSMVPTWDLRLHSHVNNFRALGIENLLKAILVAKEEKPPITHDLQKLARLTGIPLSDRQGTLLRELTSIIKWRGRYHVPLQIDEMTPRYGLRAFPALPGELGEDEDKEVVSLIRAIVEAYNTALKAFESVRRRRSKAEWEKNQPGIPWPGESS